MNILPKLQYSRTVNPIDFKSSAFIFGPRMTGKSHLLSLVPAELFIDLLDPQQELAYRLEPKKLWGELQPLAQGSRVVIDEIQRVPTLLDYVQMGIEKLGHQFLLSGSSARKLKRGAANMLGGRALDLKMHPLSHEELGDDFSVERAIHYGTLPRISQLCCSGSELEARKILQSYYTTYIKEEVQAEALVRNLGAFQRFLGVAAQANGSIIEYLNIGRDCQVPANTVKEYFQILEDTLLGNFLPQWNASERKKSRSKFYFFDCGVTRALQQQLTAPPLPRARGILFEQWVVRELIRLRDNHDKEHSFSYWRERDYEIDILIENARGIAMAVEIKSSDSRTSVSGINAFRKKFPNVPLVIVSLTDTHPRLTDESIEVLPSRVFLERYLAL
jgi:uncharacterized protein